MKILIIEDDPRVHGFLQRGLKAEGYQTELAEDGTTGLGLARELHKAFRDDAEKSLIILDIMLPQMNGLEVCQQLRAEGFPLPILMLTALNDTDDRVTGLRTGADDYLGKPFDFEELLARIEGLARRGLVAPDKQRTKQLSVADLHLDLDSMRVFRGDEEISLTAKELALLELMMRSVGRLFSRERILSNVWGLNEDPLTNIVDVYIRRLRNKIDTDNKPQLIHTQRGLGYRLEALE
jgi:DNA-binding response OmpR family regulator